MAEDYTPYSGAYTGAQIDSILAKANASESYTTAEKTKLSTLFNYDDTLVKSDISDLKSDKVDKVSGKGLSTNDYTTAEKTKLSGIEAEANKTVVDTSLSSTSTNPVRNSVIKSALDAKVNKVNGKGLSTNDYTTAEKTKLSSLSNYDDSEVRSLIAGKQNTLTFDSTPTEQSTNPVTSDGIYKAIPRTAFGAGTLLPASSDNTISLSDYTTVGRYYIGATGSQYVTDRPESLNYGFNMEVTTIFDLSRLRQKIYYNSPNTVGTYYERYLVSTGWTSWYKFSGEVVT